MFMSPNSIPSGMYPYHTPYFLVKAITQSNVKKNEIRLFRKLSSYIRFQISLRMTWYRNTTILPSDTLFIRCFSPIRHTRHTQLYCVFPEKFMTWNIASPL
jgi:hypothetical protein